MTPYSLEPDPYVPDPDPIPHFNEQEYYIVVEFVRKNAFSPDFSRIDRMVCVNGNCEVVLTGNCNMHYIVV